MIVLKILRVGLQEQNEGTCDTISCYELGLAIDKNDREVALEKRSYVLDELVKTERDYVRDLSLVVEDYLEVIRDPVARECDIKIPEHLLRPDVQHLIFCNIEQIYEWHKKLVVAM